MRALPFFAGVVLAAAVGAAAATLLSPSEPKVPETVSRKLARLESRLDDLESSAGVRDPGGLELEVRELRAEVSRLQDRSLGTAEANEGLPAAPATGEAGGVDGTGPADEDVDPKLEEKVRELVAQTDRRRLETWGNRFAEMREQREKSMLDRFQDEQALSSYQREQLDRILARRRQAIGEFFRTMFSEGADRPDMDAIRRKVADVREETDDELKNVLTPTQYEAFTELESTTRRGPPWMGGGGPPGGR
jgi:hypothetical protein